MKHLNKTKKIIISITTFISLGIFYPIAIFVPKAIWAKGLMSFDDADPDDVDKILSFSANGASFLIPLIIMMFIIIFCGLIGTYFIVKGKTKFEKRWGWMTAIAGGFGISAIYALVSLLINKESRVRIPTASKGFKTTTLIVTPIIALAPIVGVAMYHAGPDQATHINGVKLAKAHDEAGNLSGKTNIIELFTDGLDPNLGLPIIQKDHNLNDFEVFDHFVAPGGETSYSLPLEISGLEEYNEFTARFRRAGHTATMMQKNVEGELGAFHKLFSDSFSSFGNNQYLINPTSMGGKTYMAAVSGYPKMAHSVIDSKVEESDGKTITKPVNVKIVNWAQTKADLAGKFGISNYAPDNAFFGWFNKESSASPENLPTHVYLREGMTHSPRNTAPDGSVSYWTGKNSNGKDLTLMNATSAEITSLDKTMKHLKDIDAYDNSLIIIYGDHSNHKTPLAHPKNGLTDGDKYHSVAMIKYPGQKNTTNDLPITSHIGFYGGDIHKVIEDFESGTAKTFEEQFIADKRGIFENKGDKNKKTYLTFYKDHAGYFQFDGVSPKDGDTADRLTLVDKTPVEFNLDMNFNNGHRNPGWVTYKEFETYVKSLPEYKKPTKENPHASEKALQLGLDVLFLHGGIN